MTMEFDQGLDGEQLHDLAKRLWPIHRSITGDGTRETLRILQEYLPGLQIHEVTSGTQVFDWTIPDEWNVRCAQIIGPDGEVVVDYADSNLHIVGYSIPVDIEITLDELQPHLHSIPEQPNAVPFVTSYYHPTWGFCLPDNVRKALKPGTYRARIDSTLAPGSLTYADLVLPGKVEDEIFISTYVCHPSLANNELSGPMVAVGLATWVMANPEHHYTYRFAFTPESIGAITYASRHLERLKARVIAGFQLTCIGDDRHYTYLASRHGNTRIDRIAKRVLSQKPNYVEYSYLGRGSDERTYSSAGVDLPFISIMRTRYGDYPEYHSSEDDLVSVVTPTGLQGGLDAVKECIHLLETEPVLTTTTYGEPQLGKRGLYHTMLNKNTSDEVMLRTNILAYADGNHDVSDMVDLFETPRDVIASMVLELVDHDLIHMTSQSSDLTTGRETKEVHIV
jgi:aminopeptidase-like protein